MSSHSRVHYMDNLRAFAMLAGVLFHAALAYSPLFSQFWLTADPQQSAVLQHLAFFSHTFRMPLFFVIAGFFGAMLLARKGLAGLIKNRLLRIGLPFLLFFPLVIASFVILIGWAIENVEHKSTMLGFAAMMAQNPEAPQPPLTTTHLWFLYNLLFFYALAVLLSRVNFARFAAMQGLAMITSRPWVFLMLFPLMLVPALLTQPTPLPAPEQFTPQLWSFGYYGVMFALGWGLFGQQSVLDRFKSYAWPMLILSLIGYRVYTFMLPGEISIQEVMAGAGQSPEFTTQHIISSIIEAYLAVYMTLVLLIVGKQVLNHENKVLRLISDSSYWVYIIHLPLLWFIQFWLLDQAWPAWAEFLLSTSVTFVLGLFSYLLLVRWTPLGWLLNGRKSHPSDTQPSVDLDNTTHGA